MKRLADLSDVLQSYNFNNPTHTFGGSKKIADFLAAIAQSHAVARVPKEGGRLLHGLLTLTPTLVGILHQAIKQKLPGAPLKIAQAYGDIYLRAWKPRSDQ